MTRFTKTESGKYKIAGKMFEVLVGTRAQVWHGTAYKTSGGLCKPDLMQNHAGRIVSKAKHATAKKEMRLLKHGYGTQKGKFGFVKLSGHHGRKSRHSRKTRGRGRGRSMRGGSGITSQLSPHDFSADSNFPTSGVNMQIVATQH
jgi:hypothetical protein